MTAYEKLTKCYECVKSKIDFEPKVALVLGSGLGDYANSIDVKYTLSYKDIEGFPTSTVEGHKGRFRICWRSACCYNAGQSALL